MTSLTHAWSLPGTRASIRPRVVLGVTAAALIVAGATLLMERTLHADTGTRHWETPLPAITLGAIIGLTYGLLGVGIVLIYKSNRIINFAHGATGAFIAAVFGVFATHWHIPYWPAFFFALAVAVVVGAVSELAVVRRLRSAPNVMSVVATVGLGQFLIALAYSFNSSVGVGLTYPQPTGLPTLHVGALLVTPAYTGMLILAPTCAIALAIFLKKSRFGLALRGAAANEEAARLAGVFPAGTSMVAWSIAAVLAGVTAILIQPTEGFVGQGTAGWDLLLPALAAAALARMSSLLLALVAGVALGVINQLLLWNYPTSNLWGLVLFVIVVVAFLAQRARSGREHDKASWASVETLKPLPEHLRRLPAVRSIAPVTATIALIVAVVLPAVITNASAATLTQILSFAIIGLSVAIVTGLGGQLTLGQFALAAIGGTAFYLSYSHQTPFLLATLAGGAAAALAAVLAGLPALRLRGLVLAVTSLAFASMTYSWLLDQSWMLGGGVVPPTPVVFGYRFDTARSYYYVALVALIFALWLAHNVRRSSFGRQLIAVRDNEENARAFTLSPVRIRCQAFLVSGFIAGIGGAIFAGSLPSLSGSIFSAPVGGTVVDLSIVTMTVIGGMSLLVGPVIGALIVIGLPAFVHLNAAAFAASQFGLLVIILYAPRGVLQVVEPVRDRLAKFLAKAVHGQVETQDHPDHKPEPSSAPFVVAAALNGSHAESTPLLSAHELAKHYGGVLAAHDVSIEVARREIVGIIGPNGAGKTTTFELLGGFIKADHGTVEFDGKDLTGLSPEARGRRGLLRSFQDAALFPTLTVEEVTRLAVEARRPPRIVASLAGVDKLARRRASEVTELLRRMGLEAYRTHRIRELSTGTRRITELTCLIALRPKLLLLDEPSSGIAQSETRALGQLLQRLRDELAITLVVIEHDIPLVMSLSDRMLVMADGEVIANGPPDDVRRDPNVVRSYFGEARPLSLPGQAGDAPHHPIRGSPHVT